MKIIATFIGAVILASLSIGCGDKPCSRLVNGVYQYPSLPTGRHFTQEQFSEYIDIPKDIRNCISTQGLIESCLTYPEINLIMAGSNPQKGYGLVFDKFSGLRDLESRGDASDQLLVKYESVDPLKVSSFKDTLEAGRFVANLRYIEIILSQHVYLEKLSIQQKISLVSRAQTVYSLKKELGEYYALFGLATTSAILGRLMKMDNYPAFVEVYNKPKNSKWDVVPYYWSTDFETTEKIYSISENYLAFLKSNK